VWQFSSVQARNRPSGLRAFVDRVAFGTVLILALLLTFAVSITAAMFGPGTGFPTAINVVVVLVPDLVGVLVVIRFSNP